MTLDVHPHNRQTWTNSSGVQAQARSKDKQPPMALSKAQWVAKFKDNGMSVPTTWTVLQMKATWAELQEEYHGDVNPEMEQLLKDLKRTATKKKADLVEMAHSEGIEVSKTATMAQVYSLIEKEFRQRFEPVGSEEVGFGKHGDMTFRQICEEKKDYMEWCRKTVVESDSPCWRMERLVKYAQEFSKKEGNNMARGSMPTMKSSGKPKAKAKQPTPGRHPGYGIWDEDAWEIQYNQIHSELMQVAEDGAPGGEDRQAVGGPTAQGAAGDVSERGPIQDLLEEAAVMLAKKWEASMNPYSTAWSQLVDNQRPLLMELACYPDSVLGTEVERQLGKDHIIRLSHWNGADLETREGVSLVKTMLRRLRPRNLWISCECGPFSPLQRINQRTPEQRERLQEKQYRAMLQYTGAIEVRT